GDAKAGGVEHVPLAVVAEFYLMTRTRQIELHVEHVAEAVRGVAVETNAQTDVRRRGVDDARTAPQVPLPFEARSVLAPQHTGQRGKRYGKHSSRHDNCACVSTRKGVCRQSNARAMRSQHADRV